MKLFHRTSSAFDERSMSSMLLPMHSIENFKWKTSAADLLEIFWRSSRGRRSSFQNRPTLKEQISAIALLFLMQSDQMASVAFVLSRWLKAGAR